MADRDLLARLPEVELADLPGPVDGALVGAPGSEARAHLAQVVVEDRLAAFEAELRDQLADAGAGHAVVALQQALDLLLEGVEFGGRLRSAVGRRVLRRQGAPDGFPMQAGAPADLPNRDAVDEVQPPDLRPVLHVDHPLLLASISSIGRASGPGRMAPAPRQGGQFSTGAGGPVFRRRLQLADRAAMSRGDLVDFERGNRNFRIFTVVRLAGAMGVAFSELFAGVANWHIRPLAPPEFLPGEAPTKAERDQLLVRLWREGRGEQEIAEALDLARTSIGPYIRELRDAGEELPYRRSPRSDAEVRARRRRGDVCLRGANFG